MVKHIPSYRVSAALWERHLQNLCKGQHPLLDPCLWSRRDASKTADNTDMSQKHCYVAQATALQTCRRTASTLSRTRTSHSASKNFRRVGEDLTGAADSSDAICGHLRHQWLPTMLPGHCRRQTAYLGPLELPRPQLCRTRPLSSSLMKSPLAMRLTCTSSTWPSACASWRTSLMLCTTSSGGGQRTSTGGRCSLTSRKVILCN